MSQLLPERPVVIGSPEWHQNMSRYMMTIETIIRDQGWAIQGIFPTQESPGPEFYYTIGLTNKGLPELVVADLPLEVAQSLLGEVAGVCIKTGHAPTTWSLPNGHQVRALSDRSCDSKGLRLSVCHQYYRGHVQATQLLWPDTEGTYPTDPAWALNLQPLCEPLPEARRKQ